MKITTNAGVVLGLTTFDRDLTFAGTVYHTLDGIDATALRVSQGSGVDNLSIDGTLSSSFIRDADLLAGLYDQASVELFQVNWAESPLVSRILLCTGYIGNLQYSDGGYTAEIRALSSRLTQQIGEQTSGTCRVFALGDTRCKVKLTAVAISAITQTNPAVITTATAHGRIAGDGAFFTDVTGMVLLNGQVQPVLASPAPTSTTFAVQIDTSAYPVFGGAGFIGYQFTRPLLSAGLTPGSTSQRLVFNSDITPPGFYSYGTVSFTSGLNAGISREVKAHTVPIFGQATLDLQEAFPFACAPGDTALLTAGCDRTLGVCDSRFANSINYRAENLIPGLDSIFLRGRG
jgi:uncharacterized phage protein (TIGR02218 family)